MLSMLSASRAGRQVAYKQTVRAFAAKKVVVHTGKPWEDKCGIARLVSVDGHFNISITAFQADTAAEQVTGCLDQMDAAIKLAGGRGAEDITISHIISNDVPKYAYEIAEAHRSYMDAVGNVPASTILGGTFGAEWMIVEMWASGIIQTEAPEVEMIRVEPGLSPLS